ncbi:MAG: hypothetical protein WBP45_06000 [Daejeonella sp.]
MEEYLNKWLYLDTLYYKSDFQLIDNLEFVHVDDRDYVKNNLINTIYVCIDLKDGFLIVKSKKHILRVKPNAVKGFLPSSKFKWDDKVFQITKPEIEATIDDFFWHHKDQKYYYQLIVGGKKKSNRYSESDLMIISK